MVKQLGGEFVVEVKNGTRVKEHQVTIGEWEYRREKEEKEV